MAIVTLKRHGDCDIKVSGVVAFDNESFNGLEVNWFCEKLGFGACTFLFGQNDEGNMEIKVESEHMARNDDKEFLTALFEEIIKRADVVE